MPTWRGKKGLPSLSSRADIQCRVGAKAALVINRTKKVKKAEMAATTNQPARRKALPPINTAASVICYHLTAISVMSMNVVVDCARCNEL